MAINTYTITRPAAYIPASHSASACELYGLAGEQRGRIFPFPMSLGKGVLHPSSLAVVLWSEKGKCWGR